MANDQLEQQIAAHDAYLKQLEALASQVNGIQPTGYYAYGKGLAQFNKDRASKLQEIRSAASKAEQNLKQFRSQAAKPDASKPKPLTENQVLANQAREDKRTEAIESEEPQKKLAQSKLEQQKAADAASIPALGAGGQSLRELLTNSTIKRDKDGNYVFTQDNTDSKPTAAQKTAAQQLNAAFKPLGIQPEEVFGAGVPAVQFDAKGNSIPAPNGNPFIGTRQQFDTLSKLYAGAQIPPTRDLVVPAGTLDRVYQSAAPAYGDTFPGNPVAIDRKTPAAVALAGLGSPGEEGYVAPAANTATDLALQSGRTDAIADEMGRPIAIDFSQRNPLVPAQGPAATILGPQLGPEEPTTPAPAPDIASGLSTKYGVAPEVVQRYNEQNPNASLEQADADLRAIGQTNALKKRVSQVGELGTAAGLLSSPVLLPVAANAAAITGVPKLLDYLSKKNQDSLDARRRILNAQGIPVPEDAPTVDVPPVELDPNSVGN